MPRNRMRRSRSARSWIPVLFALFILAFQGCGKDEGPAQGDQQQAHGGQHKPGGRPEQQSIPVAVTLARPGTISSYYRATATLEAEKEAQVLARVSGMVRELMAEEGDLVTKGDPLLRIDNDEYRFRLEQAEAATVNLRSRFDRLTQMRDEELTTEEEFQAGRSDLASAEADEGLARLNLSYTTVKAPFSGAVTQRLVNLGQNLSTGEALFVMADFDPLLARVHVPSREFKKLRQDQTVDLVLDSSGQRLSGRIKLISPVIDPASGTIKLTVEVPDYPAGTRPGDFAQVMIVTERREDVILVPKAAVVTDKSEQIVYVVVEGQGEGTGGGEGQGVGPTAERRIVEVGFTDDDNAEILSGLAAGEVIVVKGQRSLKHGTPLKILEDDTAGAGS